MRQQTRFEVTPQTHARRAMLCACTVTVVAVIFWTLAALPEMPIHGVWQLCAVLCMTAAIVVFARYAAHRHTCTLYFDDDRFEDALIDGEETKELEDALEDGNCWSFKVTEIQSGNRRLVVCHLNGTDILSCLAVTDKPSFAAARAQARGHKVYNYCDDMYPPTFCQFLMQNGDEVLCVRFSPDAAMQQKMLSLFEDRVYVNPTDAEKE